MAWRIGPVKALMVTMLLFLLTACAPSLHNSAGRAPTVPTDPMSRMQNITPGSFVLFARITFTADTTYDQAVAILRGHVYPWMCDDPHESTPPSASNQQASFAASHTLLMSYPMWDELERIASSPQVVSVENAPLYQCS